MQYEEEKSTVRKAAVFEAPDHIVDNIYLGGESSAIDLDWLREHKVDRVLIVAAYCEAHFPEDLEYLTISIDDSPLEALKPHFATAMDFIQKSSSTNVLVHCISGISRSSTLVIAYVMKTLQVSFEEAWQLVKEKRACVYPNSGFQEQLRDFEVEWWHELPAYQKLASEGDNDAFQSDVKRED
ncbi:unnamed protein product [Durusdinium trenchii]